MKRFYKSAAFWMTAFVIGALFLGGCGSSETMDRGKSYYEQAQYGQAENCFSQELTLDASSVDAAVWYGMSLMRQEKYSDAEQVFLNLGKNEKEKKTSYWGLGVCYSEAGYYEQAVSVLEKGLELTDYHVDSYDYDMLRWLASAYYQTEAYEKSADAYTRLLKLGETVAETDVLNDLIVRMSESRRYEEAYELAVQAASLDGANKQSIRWNEAVLSEQVCKEDVTIRLLEKYCADYPADTDAAGELSAWKEKGANTENGGND